MVEWIRVVGNFKTINDRAYSNHQLEQVFGTAGSVWLAAAFSAAAQGIDQFDSEWGVHPLDWKRLCDSCRNHEPGSVELSPSIGGRTNCAFYPVAGTVEVRAALLDRLVRAGRMVGCPTMGGRGTRSIFETAALGDAQVATARALLAGVLRGGWRWSSTPTEMNLTDIVPSYNWDEQLDINDAALNLLSKGGSIGFGSVTIPADAPEWASELAEQLGLKIA